MRLPSLAPDLSFVALLALVGCGDNLSPTDEPPVPTPGGPVTILHQNVPVTELAFPATSPNGHGSALFVVRNDTDATIASITMAMSGDPGFAIDDTMSTCVAGPELVPHDLCTVMVRWTAAAADATAQLVVTSGDVITSLPIRGQVGVSGDVVADASHIDFGVVPIGSTVSVDVRLTNTSANPIEFVPGSYQLVGLSFGQSDCPSQQTEFFRQFVPPNGSCIVNVVFTATTPGWVEAIGLPIRPLAFGIPTPTFDAYAAHRLSVVKRGTGTGRIFSVPSAIDCGTDCGAQNATVIGDATLYEQTDDGSHFAGWQLACGTDPSCVVVERAEGYVSDQGTVPVGVTFAGPDSPPLAFTIDGSASGKVFVGSRVTTPNGSYYDQITECTQSCTTYVPVGTQLELYAATPSTFAGWTGDCIGGDVTCELQTAGDAAATVTFVKDDRELVTLIPDVPAVEQFVFAPGSYRPELAVYQVEFAPNGDLLALDRRLKIGRDGTVQPSSTTTPLPDVSTGGTWSCQVPDGSGSLTYPMPSRRLFAPNGDVGVLHEVVVNGQDTNVLSVFKPDASLRFRVDFGRGCAIAVAVGPDGGYQALVGDQLGVVYATSFHVVRYDASGNLLAGSGPYTMSGAFPSVAIDSAGALAFHMVATDTLPLTGVIGRILFDGTVAFTTQISDYNFGPTGIGYDAAGNVITSSGRLDVLGVHLEQRSPAGSLLWEFDKSSDLPSQGVQILDVRDVAFSPTGQVAIAGSYGPVTDGSLPWIEVFQMP